MRCTPAAFDAERISSSGCLTISSRCTSVLRLCGAKKRVSGNQQLMAEDTRELLCELIFRYSEMMVQARLRTPADMHGGINVGQAPVHHGGKLLPIVNLFKRHILNRRTGDNHAVEALIPELVEGFVKSLQVSRGDMAADVAGHLHQSDINLQRRVAEQTQKLILRFNLGGHQVDNHDFERTNVLCDSALVRHDKDIFAFQYFISGKIRRNTNGHGTGTSVSFSVREKSVSYYIAEKKGKATVFCIE